MNARHVTWHDGVECPAAGATNALPPPHELSPPAEQADARLLVREANGTLAGHAALWWTHAPPFEHGKLGVIGGFAAVDADAAREVLESACVRLARADCEHAAGPMNGNTWRRYRLVVDGTERGPFPLEPRNPPQYPAWWRAAGFVELASYSSSLVVLDGKSTVADEVAARLAAGGVTIRPLDPQRFEDDLAAIYAVTVASFTRNFLYTPLDWESFLHSYQLIRDRIDPRFVRIAWRAGVACGYVFAIPDFEAAARGEKPALVVKTLAVDPAARCAGLGSVLVGQVHQLAWQAGFTEAIHALQHQTNTSRRITSRHQGTIFRTYALFGRNL